MIFAGIQFVTVEPGTVIEHHSGERATVTEEEMVVDIYAGKAYMTAAQFRAIDNFTKGLSENDQQRND